MLQQRLQKQNRNSLRSESIMCIICIELEKGSLMPWEANRNLKEMSEVLDDEHIKEVEELIQLVQLEEELCDECILDEE